MSSATMIEPTTDPLATQAVQDAFDGLSKLEKQFASVELDALRRREHSLQPLYTKRTALLRSIPSFWPTILPHGPDAFTSCLRPFDAQIIDSITSLTVTRYQIKSATEGEPRSLRFTFEFGANDWFTDKTVTKDFEYVTRTRGEGDDAEEVGGFVSKPVGFSWTKEGKKMGLGSMLDRAVELWEAEEGLVKESKGKVAVEEKERRGLWQYEKLREAIEAAEEDEQDEDEGAGGSFLEWFGFRGMVNPPKAVKDVMDEGAETEEDDGDDDGMLDVEIFPAGEEVAVALGEELWENVMDVFMQAQMGDELEFDEMDEDEEDDEDAPELVELGEEGDAEEFGGFEDERPSKKQKKN